MRTAALVALSAALALFALGLGCTKASTLGSTASRVSVPAADEAPLMSIDAMISRAGTRSYWPNGANDWQALSAADQQALIAASPACQDFVSFVFPADADDPAQLNKADVDQALRTDGALVIKGGQIVYENYVGPYAGHPEKRHCMWSATKSFTTGMVGSIAEDSANGSGVLTPAGQPITLSTRLGDMADLSAVSADPRLANMTIEDVLSMNIPDPVWNEGYDGNIQTSNVVHMLYVDGPPDMAKYAASALMGPAPATGPVNEFTYSSGNAVILMRVLQELYGDDAFATLPWTQLFDRLGMTSAMLERDQRGVFVGSSYAHMTLRDMARFGYAYLNGGYFNGQQVIDPTFVQAARVIGAGMLAPGTTDSDITEEGSFYSLGFWINPNPQVLQ